MDERKGSVMTATKIEKRSEQMRAFDVEFQRQFSDVFTRPLIDRVYPFTILDEATDVTPQQFEATRNREAQADRG